MNVDLLQLILGQPRVPGLYGKAVQQSWDYRKTRFIGATNVQKIHLSGAYNPAQVSNLNTVGIRNTLIFLPYCTLRYDFPPDETFCWGLGVGSKQAAFHIRWLRSLTAHFYIFLQVRHPILPSPPPMPPPQPFNCNSYLCNDSHHCRAFAIFGQRIKSKAKKCYVCFVVQFDPEVVV